MTMQLRKFYYLYNQYCRNPNNFNLRAFLSKMSKRYSISLQVLSSIFVYYLTVSAEHYQSLEIAIINVG
jgi:hypothetical protein